ncbi:hypothetical protein F5Y10DRAFT_273910 [Nemania abortiva]|nr:hypothetical protein F5Y10DRAFT_273910 [Nemania abortiva]
MFGKPNSRRGATNPLPLCHQGYTVTCCIAAFATWLAGCRLPAAVAQLYNTVCRLVCYLVAAVPQLWGTERTSYFSNPGRLATAPPKVN